MKKTNKKVLNKKTAYALKEIVIRTITKKLISK
jgi:hypothetical protein